MMCPNCQKDGPHFVPPSMGEDGFYICDHPDGRKVTSLTETTICDRYGNDIPAPQTPPPDTVSVPVEKLREALHEFERLHDSRREADMFNGPNGDPTSSAAYAAAAGAYLHCADVIRAMLSAPLGPKGGQYGCHGKHGAIRPNRCRRGIAKTAMAPARPANLLLRGHARTATALAKS